MGGDVMSGKEASMAKCGISGCDNKATKMEPPRCMMHLRDKEDAPKPKSKHATDETCLVPGCNNKAARPARGLCWTCYGVKTLRAEYARSSKRRGPKSTPKKKPAAPKKKVARKKKKSEAVARGPVPKKSTGGDAAVKISQEIIVLLDREIEGRVGGLKDKIREEIVKHYSR
jgi:hypothetical protein